MTLGLGAAGVGLVGITTFHQVVTSIANAPREFALPGTAGVIAGLALDLVIGDGIASRGLILAGSSLFLIPALVQAVRDDCDQKTSKTSPRSSEGSQKLEESFSDLSMSMDTKTTEMGNEFTSKMLGGKKQSKCLVQ